MKLRNKKTGGLANLIVDKELLRVKTDAGWADYSSLAELNEEWEDYVPKEPLIKDEKIRKAVRAWAEANGCGSSIGVAINGPNIQFEYVVGSVHHPLAGCFLHINAPVRFRRELKFCNNCTECYTIDELCGEEE